MFTFQFLVSFIMDHSYSFSPHHRRTSKFEQALPFLKGKSCSEVSLRTSRSNTMLDAEVGSRTLSMLFQGYNQRTNSHQKSYFDKECGPYFSKTMIPKSNSATISIRQQTIVGGFVGSKNYAGGSLFPGSRQIWDFLSMFLSGSPFEGESISNRTNNTKISNYLNQTSKSLNKNQSCHKICDEVSYLCLSSVSIPEGLIAEGIDAASPKDLDCFKPAVSEENTHNKSILKESAEKPSSNISTSFSEKYNSVVNGTCSSSKKSALSESSVEIPPANVKFVNCSMVNVPPISKQSYAEVAKTVPPKPIGPRGRDFDTETQNYKKKLMRSKSNKCSDIGGRVRSMDKSTNLNMSDIIEGDTRWRSKVRSKKPEYKGCRPSPIQSRCGSASGNGSATDNSDEVKFYVAPEIGSGKSLCWEILDKEPLNACSRRRRLSECSLDSEDSVVVFACSPESSISSSPYTKTCVYPSVELEESEDESSSSGEYSSSEDDESGDNVEFLYNNSSPKPPVTWEFFKGTTRTVKQVRFAEGSALAVVRPMIAWSYAYREARRGNWEVYSRDRARFQCRINNLAPVLNSVLDPEHRKRVFESRFVER